MAFITEIANHIKKNYDLSKESLTIIFPNKRAALKLRTELKNSKLETNIWLPQLLSIQEAMCSWSGMQLLDNIDITFELIKILNNFNKITSNDIFGLASQMLKDFDEIDQYAIDAKNLFQNTEEAKKLDLLFVDENRTIDKKYIEFFSSLNDYYLSLRKVLLETLAKVESCKCDIHTSCYNCLRNYKNQRRHKHLSRKGAIKVIKETLG